MPTDLFLTTMILMFLEVFFLKHHMEDYNMKLTTDLLVSYIFDFGKSFANLLL